MPARASNIVSVGTSRGCRGRVARGHSKRDDFRISSRRPEDGFDWPGGVSRIVQYFQSCSAKLFFCAKILWFVPAPSSPLHFPTVYKKKHTAPASDGGEDNPSWL